MVFPRLIPLLLVRSGGLQKSEKFSAWKYVGDVLNAIKIFNEKDVDEVVVLDVDATRERRGPDFDMLEQLAGECFMPLSYGGGVDSADVARRVMGSGVEKVIVNSSAWSRPALVAEIASVLGSSSTVVSCDVVASRRGVGRFDYLTGLPSKDDLLPTLRELINLGAGEIIVQSKDRDGTLKGPDLNSLRIVTESVTVPVVYAGGVSSIEDCIAVWKQGASGVGAGAWFVFRGPHRAVLITYPNYELVRESYSHLDETE
jgi:imidazole glycerol-phosphate synthase subunit HisF